MADSVLVVGGAGYIGSHMVKLLASTGHEVVVFDDLSTGHRDAIASSVLVEGDLRDPVAITKALALRKFSSVLHFAAKCYVGESVQDPAKYYGNNVLGTANLLEAMRTNGVGKLVFSSSCSTYGDPVMTPMTEEHPQDPVNPYGATKLMGERAMKDYGRAYGLRTVALRYFNASGLDADGTLGERHDPETHLIPLVLREALRLRAGGARDATQLQVFGDDFDTPDGTCIRDYVHVSDLCAAHLLAMRRLDAPGRAFEAFNLGSEKGSSVLDVIECCRRITGQDIGYKMAGRRAGDPARLIASSERARRDLGWSPRYADLPEIVSTAWRWFSRT
ncbi:UDP-glucose 4-epimerase [Usitatibacter rugosus]|uniref:UDP-glucose 4-epimerase n=1 Tax=Usitatibacter rugosus TaxID=2732067 RepID=A0A6M4GWV3_9PROT|nr:UDP-glucose 4-epimerase GalE [Usitatibacter rugosus]QJR11726.1 UDP-glucose 4-epimerase [Usitatibacter rugosus]